MGVQFPYLTHWGFQRSGNPPEGGSAGNPYPIILHRLSPLYLEAVIRRSLTQNDESQHLRDVGTSLPRKILNDLPVEFLIPTLVDRPTVIAAGSAGLLAVLLSGLPLKLGLLIAAMAGIGIGVWVDRKSTNVEP